MKREIRTATAEYTGGGIYIFYGQLEDGHWFLTSDECTEILNADPSVDWDESGYWEWQEAHLVEMLEGDEDREFCKDLYTRIIKDLQDGAEMNASEGEIQTMLDDLKDADAKTYRVEWTGDYSVETIYESDTKADAEKFLHECVEGIEAYKPEEIDCDRYEILWETETRVKFTRYAEDDGEILEFEDWYELVEEDVEA